jgi:enoyl-CoA hydratase/carnithine racemase
MKTFHERVTLDIEGGIARVLLARPEKMNALDRDMFLGIAAAIEELRGLGEVRAIVLSGAGRCFCAGLDLKSATTTGPSPADLLPRTHGLANLYQQVAWGWRTLPVPVIAAVHGVAFGGGLQIALGADLRIVAPDARLSVMEIKHGLIPDMAGVARMVALCRDDRVRELTFTGREISGEEAVRYGLATHANPDPLAEATRLATEIAGKNSEAIRAGKRLFNQAFDRAAKELLEAEAAEQGKLLGPLLATGGPKHKHETRDGR